MNEEMNNYDVPGDLFYCERPRLSRLFEEAVKYPFVTVCAGAGYGKSSAVHDFVEKSGIITVWVQLSERDNLAARFWENFMNAIAQVNRPFAKALGKLGFPDTDDKLNQFLTYMRAHVEEKGRILVFDDFHLIEDPAVLYFVDFCVPRMIKRTSVFLVSRTVSSINIAGMASKGLVYNISENELRFTEGELALYFSQMGSPLRSDSLREIYNDTEGWAFAINLIARSYSMAPGYKGYLRDAMKTNVFRLMEAESFNRASKGLQSFFIRLSLISHLSVELISLLAGGDQGLIDELERQSAYVRRDNYTNAYLIHNLFLEFLCEKQGLLTDEERRGTYEIAADWCNRNGFRIDALSYYEKVGDYESIVSIFLELPTQVPHDIAKYTEGIFERAPEEAFDSVMLLAAMHVRCVLCLGKWGEALELMERYEERFLGLPEGDQFRDRTLGAIYYCWAITRMLICTVDDRYDFDVFFAKQDECLTRSPINPGAMANHPMGPWVSLVGSSRKGAPQEYIASAERAERHASHCMNGAMTGVSDLAMGELLYYQTNIQAAEPFIVRGLGRAKEHRQFDAVYMARFYTLRMAVCQGNFEKAEQAIADIEAQLEETDYANRYITYDIATGWYYTYLGLPGLVPDWLKEKFVPYGHTYFIENLGNRMKARYRYITKDYPLLLAYMQEQKEREAILFGRVEMLSMEACVHLKMKNRPCALAVLKEAYEAAAPNEVLIPFVALGKDMRTLCSAALKDPGSGIPAAWLETVKSKASSYAKRQSHVISEYRKAHGIEEDVVLSAREIEVLSDLSHGLSRSEIATGRGLSVNTVKMVINSVYAKLGAGNLADLIRIATERKMI